MKPHATPVFEEQKLNQYGEKKKKKRLIIRNKEKNPEYSYFEETSQHGCERYSEFSEME